MSLIDEIAGPEGDLLDIHRLLTGQWPPQGSHPELRRIQQRWQDLPRLHEDLARRRSEGYQAVLTTGETRLFEALGNHLADVPRLVAIVPNIQGLMRDAVEYGMVGAGLRRVWRAGALALAGMGLRNIKNIGAVVKRDFPTMLQGFIELELAGLAKFHPPAVVLQPQMTDLAVAMQNPRIIESFISTVRARSGAVPGLFTHNAGPALAALKSWGLEVGLLITPFGAEPGWGRPDNEAAGHALKAAGIPAWADRRLSPAGPSSADRAALKRAGMVGACRDDLELWVR